MELQPRTRLAVLLATAAFGAVQAATNLLPFPLAVALIVGGPVVAWGLGNERFARLVQVGFSGRAAETKRSIAIPLAGFAFVALALAFLEFRQPYYFTEDDNFTMGPVAIAALRGFMETGELPTWNPYQFMGQPTSVQSMYGLTYPVTYLAFAAVHWLGHEQAYIEVICIVHLLAGYWAMYFAARVLGVRPLLAMTASVSFVLSGSALMIARNYATMAPLYLWMPLLVVAAEKLRVANLRWAILTALAIGLFCHSGNGQMWLYGMLFFGFAVLVNLNRRAIPWLTVAALFSLAIALFLIVPQMWFLQSRPPDSPARNGIGAFWLSLLLPTPLTEGGHPQPFPIDWTLMTPYYYAGTVLTAVTLAALIVLLALALHNRRLATVATFARQNVWLLCAGIALWIAWGKDALLWLGFEAAPILGVMGGPWKLVVYFHLFSALAGAVIVERLLRSRRAEFVIAATILILMTYSVWTTRGAFTQFVEDPYPDLPREMAALLYADPVSTRGRIASAVTSHYEKPNYVESLGRNFASWYRLSNFDGYDRFVSTSDVTVRHALRWEKDWVGAARAYGVRWLILHRSALAWHRWNVPRVWHPRMHDFPVRIIDNVTPHASVRVKNGDLVMWELRDVDPLAFVASDRRALPIELSQTGVTVDVSRANAAVVVNFLNRPGLHARVDENAVAHKEDKWGRIVVEVPNGAKSLEVRYSPPWGTAASASLVALLLGVIAAVIAKRL